MAIKLLGRTGHVAGRDVSVPPHTEVTGSPPWWALIFTLVADGTLFTSLLFGTFYLWLAAPHWPPPVTPQTHLLLALVVIATLIAAAVAARGSLRAIAGATSPPGWIVGAALALVGSIATIVVLMRLVRTPRLDRLAAESAVFPNGYVPTSLCRASRLVR